MFCIVGCDACRDGGSFEVEYDGVVVFPVTFLLGCKVVNGSVEHEEEERGLGIESGDIPRGDAVGAVGVAVALFLWT